MSSQEEIAQRRREKILSRATEEDADEENLKHSGPDVFERYKKIKDREAAEVYFSSL